jgi:hypothetical protein
MVELSIAICGILLLMARRWNKKEEKKYRDELLDLYVKKNKSLGEIALILGIAEQTVFQRLCRLEIKTTPYLKENYLLKPKCVKIPKKYSSDMAEFFGIMLGDGHLSHFQVQVNLGTKEMEYAEYVRKLIGDIFKTNPKIAIRAKGYRDVYFGSTVVTSWLFKEGLVSNKVKAQVDIPKWIFTRKDFMNSFLRGFFDTDGSVYKLKYGIQISLTNHSRPLLVSLHKMLFALRYSSSVVNTHNIYITKRADLERFFNEIQPKNPKHTRRFKSFVSMMNA